MATNVPKGMDNTKGDMMETPTIPKYRFTLTNKRLVFVIRFFLGLFGNAFLIK
jgi:cupin superfamily acireductone dioxygenase involved in methionine salvage